MAGLGRKVFTRETLGSAEVNGYLMDQVIMRFPSASARSAVIPTPSEGMHTYLDDAGRVEFFNGAGWESLEVAAQDRVPFTSTGSVGNTNALHATVTIPAVSVPTKVTLLASGKGGFAAAARTMRWEFDTLPASVTGVTEDEDVSTDITLGATEWGALTATLEMDVPAGVAPTFRTIMRSDGNAYNRGSVLWTRMRRAT